MPANQYCCCWCCCYWQYLSFRLYWKILWHIASLMMYLWVKVLILPQLLTKNNNWTGKCQDLCILQKLIKHSIYAKAHSRSNWIQSTPSPFFMIQHNLFIHAYVFFYNRITFFSKFWYLIHLLFQLIEGNCWCMKATTKFLAACVN